MNLSDFDYELPKELIAQEALPKRSEARLMVLDRQDQSITHKKFQDISALFEEGDLLVLNDTKVVPARLFARRKTGGRVEILVLKNGKEHNQCEALIRPSGRVKKDETLILASDETIQLLILDEADHETGIRHIQFQNGESVPALLDRVGRIPLPPYIDREDRAIDRELYQTIFARQPGAVASPTAGLHFDEILLRELHQKKVRIAFVTLHVGYGTFQPVQENDLSRHHMHEEHFMISDETAEEINFAKSDGRRVIACGTTVVRTLESQATRDIPSEVRAAEGETDFFITPPHDFKIVDAMITNFHLPKTTLLMLASAFAGHDFLMKAYQEAIRERYRFYSYGDAMLIL